MSAESQEIFHKALHSYREGTDPTTLRSAAVGHLGASRPLSLLSELYAAALARGDHKTAQDLADELAPVRAAEGVAAGLLPKKG